MEVLPEILKRACIRPCCKDVCFASQAPKAGKELLTLGFCGENQIPADSRDLLETKTPWEYVPTKSFWFVFPPRVEGWPNSGGRANSEFLLLALLLETLHGGGKGRSQGGRRTDKVWKGRACDAEEREGAMKTGCICTQTSSG